MVHQLAATANFARESRLVCWFVGGLDFQIEHNLFPRVSHVHYRDLARIVRATAAQHGISYLEHRTLGAERPRTSTGDGVPPLTTSRPIPCLPRARASMAVLR